MAKRVVVCNQKGGVGKSFVVVLLAFLFAMLGKRVLVVDMDPQGNASRRLKVDRFNHPTMFSILDSSNGPVRPGAVASIMQQCGWEGFGNSIYVAAANASLSALEQQMPIPGAMQALDTVLSGIDEHFDVIIIDTQRTEGHVTRVAYTAAELALIVTEPEQDPSEGAASAVAYFTQWANAYPKLRVAGIIANRKRNTKLHNEFPLRENFGDLFWGPVLPLEAGIAETMSLGKAPEPSRSVIARTLGPQIAERLLEEMNRG